MFQKTIRKGKDIEERDVIIVQAFWEICDSFHDYGPIKIVNNWKNLSSHYGVFYDEKLVLEIQKKSNQAYICYIRTSTFEWAEELCEIANAHAKMLSG